MDWRRARLYAFVHEHEIVGCGQHVPFGHELEIHQIQLVVLSEHLCVSLLQLIVQIGRENILLYQVLSLLRVCTQIFLLLVCLLPAGCDFNNTVMRVRPFPFVWGMKLGKDDKRTKLTSAMDGERRYNYFNMPIEPVENQPPYQISALVNSI